MATITVSDTSGLLKALASAAAGDVIKLAPGTYSGVQLRNLNFTSDVEITSLDPAKPAKLTDLMVRDSSGLRFTGLEFDGSTNTASSMFQVFGSRNVTLDRIFIHGSLDGNPANDVSHFMVRNSSYVSVLNSRFEQSQHALSFLDSDHLIFNGNVFRDLRTDAIRGGGSSFVTIIGNYFTNFFPAVGDHPDAIQFWTTNTTAIAHDILISGNLITRGAGGPVQGIFLRDQLTTLPYDNVTISDNLLIGTLWNGIDVQGGTDVVINDNTVVSLADQKTWIRLDDVTGARLSNNRAGDFLENRVVDVISTGSVRLAPPSDQGASFLQDWLSGHSAVDALYRGSPSPTPTGSEGQTVVRIMGTDGADILSASNSGPSNVDGLGGDDRLAGAPGTHTLSGGAGNDSYSVADSRNAIVELAGQGYDVVTASIDWSLADNVEALILAGSAVVGNGNALDNRLTGNDGANALNGFDGNDRIDGGGGNDVLSGDAGDDQVSGDGGNDLLKGGTGNDGLSGGAGDDRLEGGDGNDRLEGGDGADVLLGGLGADVLVGGRGADVMTGGGGADIFVFGKDVQLDPGSLDRITDFTRGDDRIDVSRLDANLQTNFNDRFNFIGDAEFTKTAGQLRYYLSGGDAFVCGDTNGDGIADFTICLVGSGPLSSADFIL